MGYDINEEFKDLGVSSSPPFAGLDRFTTSWAENTGTIGDVERDPTVGPLSFDWW